MINSAVSCARKGDSNNNQAKKLVKLDNQQSNPSSSSSMMKWIYKEKYSLGKFLNCIS